MALTPTVRGRGAATGSSPGTGSYTPITAFTPAANALLCVGIVLVDNGGGNIIANTTISGGGFTWTAITSVGQAGGFAAQAKAWWAETGSSPGSTTITFDNGADSVYGAVAWAIDFTGYDTTSKVGGKGTAASTADGHYGSPSGDVTLDAAPSSSDYVVHFIGFDGDTTGSYTFSAGSGFTADTAISSTSLGSAGALQYGTGKTTTTSPVWTDPDTGTMNLFSYAALAFVVKASAGAAAASIVTPRRNFRTDTHLRR